MQLLREIPRFGNNHVADACLVLSLFLGIWLLCLDQGGIRWTCRDCKAADLVRREHQPSGEE